ncbi:peptidoglycan DD-metalloendopeptidase family protein [Legionella sp. 16cNR16C]|uniref:M23 family metallopeptidase n=1 Tax=Legionella sp. 16cNR16C TaxID=2905656 RepID=UPI001E4BE45A|nr:peptidoglycan DD-metalloendopeptidase family protein [Legionella sp. 16cNR16C]MCE3044578.1 peptidoglycan DD-metalloendopeptidase family protein [Legionella sp. 16cNR16C]
MDQRPNVSINNTNKPSKLLALIALAIAFALPFILVKTFPHKIKPPVSSKSTTLSELEEQEKDIPDEEEVPVNEEEQEDTEEAEAGETIPAPSSIIEKAEQIEKADPPKTSLEAAKKLAEVKKPEIKTAKPNKPAALPPEKDWKIIKTRPGDSLALVFNRAGISQKVLQTILHDNPHTSALTRLKPGQDIQLQIKNKVLERMMLPFTSTQFLVVYRDGTHYRSKIDAKKMNSHNHFATAVVNGSLYGTAKRYNIPPKLVKQMTDIFTWDINFAKDIRAGDRFTIIYQAFYIDGKQVGTGDIVAVSYKNRGKTFQAVRHTNRDGQSDYYTPEGRSLKKAFNRYPVRFSHISSSFSLSRYHPILHYRRAHKGVDLAASIGTPIMATGSGKIEIIGRQNGYGNMIKIKHDKNYSSVYGHMLRFEKGLSRGDYVKRGQVIGYVGQSGLASGPHCHYEFHVNNFPRNPTTVDLPRGLEISAREMANFRANTRTLLAQLKMFEEAQLASAARKNSNNKKA